MRPSARRNGLTVSRNTLLRLVRKMPLPSVNSPQTLGVDDFALSKCQTYGTAQHPELESRN